MLPRSYLYFRVALFHVLVEFGGDLGTIGEQVQCEVRVFV